MVALLPPLRPTHSAFGSLSIYLKEGWALFTTIKKTNPAAGHTPTVGQVPTESCNNTLLKPRVDESFNDKKDMVNI